MIDLVVLMMMMMRLAALTASCLSALVAARRPFQTACGATDPNGRHTVANGRPTQTACGAIDPNGRPTVANGRPNQTPRGAIDPNGRPTVANGRPAQTPCGTHSAQRREATSALACPNPKLWSPSALSTRERARSSRTYRTLSFLLARSNLQMA